MRIISQKGIEPMVDLPYEQTMLVVRENFIFATIFCKADMLIANYSTPEKAEKAMESLWEKYEEIHCWNAYFYSLPSVFRFPEDSEV